MAQLNLNLTPEFERDLAAFMRERNISTKSDAIRLAIREGLLRTRKQNTGANFQSLVGTLKIEKRGRKFRTEDDLWS